jgi:hypothetical protein
MNKLFLGFKCGVIDLHIGTIASINIPTLEVVCPPPGNWSEILR